MADALPASGFAHQRDCLPFFDIPRHPIDDADDTAAGDGLRAQGFHVEVDAHTAVSVSEWAWGGSACPPQRG